MVSAVMVSAGSDGDVEHADGFVVNEFDGRAHADINILTVVGNKFIGSVHILESFLAFT
jgi:hypothetical protein